MVKDMTMGKPWRIVASFTVPVILGNLFQQVYSLADTVIVGRTIGPDALAAVGATSIIVSFFLYFIQGMANGFGIVLGQRFGAGDENGVRRSTAAALILCSIFSVAITALTVSLCSRILHWMHTPSDIREMAGAYLIAIFWGTVATVFYNLFAAVLRALGDSRTPLIFLTLAAVLNIVLDLALIRNFGMGVAGAAWATVISQAVSAVLCLITMLRKFPILRLRGADWHCGWQTYRGLLRTGFPMGFQMSVMCVGLLAVQVAINNLGTVCVTGFTAASKVDQLAVQALNAYGVTISNFAAQNFGAGRFRRIHRGTMACLIQSTLCALAAGAVVLGFGPQLIRLFMTEVPAEVMDYALRYLRAISPCYVLLAVLTTYRLTMQGIGHALVPFLACIAELILRVAAALVLARALGYLGACFATPMAWVGADCVVVTAYLLWRKQTRGCSPAADAEDTPPAGIQTAGERPLRSGSHC